jgi:hypothetical protein
MVDTIVQDVNHDYDEAQKRRTSKMLSRMTEILPLCLTPDLSLMEDLNLLKAYMDTLYELMGIDYHLLPSSNSPMSSIAVPRESEKL